MGLAFDGAEKMENSAAFNAKKVKTAVREKKEREVFLCRKTVRVKAKGKVIPTNFLKTAGRRPFVGVEERRKDNS